MVLMWTCYINVEVILTEKSSLNTNHSSKNKTLCKCLHVNKQTINQPCKTGANVDWMFTRYLADVYG